MSFPCSFSSSSLLTVPGAVALLRVGAPLHADHFAERAGARVEARQRLAHGEHVVVRDARGHLRHLRHCAGALAGAALDLLAAEIRDRAGEPGPRRTDGAALLEEEAPRLLDQLLGVGGGEAVAA